MIMNDFLIAALECVVPGLGVRRFFECWNQPVVYRVQSPNLALRLIDTQTFYILFVVLSCWCPWAAHYLARAGAGIAWACARVAWHILQHETAVCQFGVAYLLTRRKSVGAAQTWTFTGLLALGIFEYQASIVGVDFAEEFLPQLALFERIELLHRLYPVYLLGARIVAWMNYEDLETLNAFRLQHLHARTDKLLVALSELKNGLSGRRPAAGAGGAAAAPAAAQQAAAADAQALLDALPGTAGAAGEPELRSMAMHPAMAGAPPEPPRAKAAQPAKGGRSLTSLAWFVGVWVFFQWLLNRGS